MPTESRILEQRIQELESELGELISHPLDEHANRPGNLGESSHSIRRRINFLRTLLCAEKYESRLGKKLNHMSTRLSNLESSFTNWVDSRNQQEGEQHDNSSSCSCTHSCINGGDCEDYHDEVGAEDLLAQVDCDWYNADHGLEQYEFLGKKHEAMEEKGDQGRRRGRRRRSFVSEFKKARGAVVLGLGAVLLCLLFHVFGPYDIDNSIYPIPT